MSKRTKDSEGYFSISLVVFVALIKKNLLWIILVCIICGGICFAINEYVIQPRYEATATMSVITRNDDTVNITNDQITSAENLVDTYAVVIQSKKVLQQAIDNLELNVSYKSLKKMVSVKAVNGTQIMEIVVKAEHPQVAEDILTEILAVAPDEIINAIGAGAVRVIDEAESSDKKVEPHTFLNVLATVFLCVVIIPAIIIIRFLLNDTYCNDEQLQEDLDIPVLGVIPALEGNIEGADKEKKHKKQPERRKR